MRTFMGWSRSEWPCGHRGIANVVLGAALLIAGCSIVATPSTQTASALKPIDQAALQSLVDTTIKELLIPSAVVLLNLFFPIKIQKPREPYLLSSQRLSAQLSFRRPNYARPASLHRGTHEIGMINKSYSLEKRV